MVKRLILTVLLAAASDAFGTLWEFKTPPSAVRQVAVDADWTPYVTLELPIRLVSGPTRQAAMCSLFFQTKQDLWFESRERFLLSDDRRLFRLRLDDLSPHWQCANARRPFGQDCLRWVRCWGIKVFSKEEQSGRLEIGELNLVEGQGRVDVQDVILPRSPESGKPTSVRFRISGFTGNPYRNSEISASVECDGNTSVPAYFRQDYVKLLHPGTGRTSLEPLELPYWQADWTPAETGKRRISLKLVLAGRKLNLKLGDVTVRPSSGTRNLETSATLPHNHSFLCKSDTDRVFQYDNGKWLDPETGRMPEAYWKVRLDWTSNWGQYMGPGDFDQLTAWQFEQELQHPAATGAMPLVVFDQDELENNGLFNWLSNPLNRSNGGTLDRPADCFENERSLEIVLDRARYMWARYGRQPATSGLLILLNRRGDSCRTWIDRIATQLEAEFPGITILCNNPEVPERLRNMPIALYDCWQQDPLLSNGGSMRENRVKKEVIVTGRYPGSTAIITDRVQHLAGAAELTCDIYRPPGNKDPLKVMCLLRTDRNTLFQSPLLTLREAEITRACFPLDKPDLWDCHQNSDETFTRHDLLNVREVGLRFFCDGPGNNPAHVRNCTLRWPYEIDLAKEGPLAILDLKGNVNEVARFGKFELDFQINRTFNNPYNPKEVDVRIELTDPEGKALVHPGYYHEPWDLKMIDGVETTVRAGRPSWRVRVTPCTLGDYKWRLLATTEEGNASAEGAFNCTPGSSKGFIRISPRDPRYFEYSDGSFFFPIGQNMRSPGDQRKENFFQEALRNADWAEKVGTRSYEKWLPILKENGSNFTRIWMCPWWCGLEWNQDHYGYHGPDYYNQENAARLDRIIELIEQQDMYVCLETINHGALSTQTDADWTNNPVCKVTQPGGYLRYATDFFFHERAKESHRNKLRYTVARWGYSPAIMWWGVVTEAEWTEPYTRAIGDIDRQRTRSTQWLPTPYHNPQYKNGFLNWISEMGGYIRNTDAHPHIVSVHFSNPQNGTEIWNKPNTDIVHNNAYTLFNTFWRTHEFPEGRKGVADMMQVFAQVYAPYSRAKPLVIGEWGGHPGQNRKEHLIAELHTGMWAMLMTRTAGVTGYWWWNLVDAENLYPAYAAVSNFIKNEDRRGKNYLSRRANLTFPENTENSDSYGASLPQPPQPYSRRGRPSRRTSTRTNISPYTRSGIVLFDQNELFGYIYCLAINQSDYSTAAKNFADERFPESGPGTLNLPIGLTNGTYRLEYWDTYAGTVVEIREVTVSDDVRTIPIISHRVDLALKLKKID